MRLLVVGLTATFGITALVAVSRLRQLETSVTDVLSRNYRSIEAAQGMAQSIAQVQLAAHDGRAASVGPELRAEYDRWSTIERGNCTEEGEAEIVARIDRLARPLFDVALAGAPVERVDRGAAAVQLDLDTLIALNKNAMFAADRRTRVIANRLLLGALATLSLGALVVAVVGWTLSSAVARPLTHLVDRLRGVGSGGPYPTLGPQPLAELQQVADEYDLMARRLEEFERLNVSKLMDEKAKTEAVIEAIEDGLIVLDPGGGVVHANDVACAILELTRAEIVGQRFDDLATRHPHYLRVRAAVRDFLARPEREGDRVELTLFMRGRDHSFVLRLTPFGAPDGAPAGLIVALQDITYVRDQEAARAALVSTLSHELRTPLTSLSMALELLQRRDPRLDGEVPALLETAREDVTRLQDVAQRFLDLARARAMTIALDRRPVDLHAVVDRALKIFVIQAREKGVALQAQVPDGALTIAGDETKLTWALSNLLSNALRYTPAGGRVEIEALPDDANVLVAVRDTGPGIAAEQRERIFERFAQATDGGEIGSAGLGLAIVRDIVQAHGGRIRLESAVGQGSRFVLELPRS
jgi:two-component system, NtrC family, sensor histidine kinase KinB